jgi:tetratricopeptide (TPR) repeat protein
MKNKLFIIISALILTVSCEEYLEEKPLDRLTSESFYSNDINLDQATYGIYSTVLYYWRESRGAGNNIYTMSEVRSDDITLPTDGTQYSNLYIFESYNYNASHSNIRDLWSSMYQGISRANVLIERVAPIVPGTGVSETKKNTVLAEAFALRAYFYYQLVRYFGDVPLLTSSIKSKNDEHLFPSREKVSKVYEQIINDLKSSIGEGSDPKVTLPASANSARLSLGAGYGLIADVYLTLKDYTNAALYAKKAIDLNLYGLWPEYKDGFTMLNKGKTIAKDSKGRSNRIEGIWEMQFYQEIDPGTGVTISCSPRGKTVCDFIIPNRSGDGIWCATSSLFNSFDQADARRAHIFPTQFKDNTGKIVNYPATPGVTGGKYMMKYNLEGQPLAVWGWSGNQISVIRYPDILLIYAEAINELNGPTVDAYAAINEVRQRAKVSDLDGLDKNTFRDAVLQERRMEFPFEGRRYFDLLRTDKIVSEMAKVGITVNPDRILLPIPQVELDNNQNDTGFSQNPGYN